MSERKQTKEAKVIIISAPGFEALNIQVMLLVFVSMNLIYKGLEMNWSMYIARGY